MIKICVLCKKKYVGKKNYVRKYCDECRCKLVKINAKKWKKNNVDKIKAYRKKHYKVVKEKNAYLKKISPDKLLKIVEFKSTIK